MKRRAEQLRKEGKGELAQEIEKPKLSDISEGAFSGAEVIPLPRVEQEPVSAKRRDIDEEYKDDERSLDDAVEFVYHTLSGIVFQASSSARAIAEREVRGMTSEECEHAVRAATQNGILQKPAYYSALLDRVQREGQLQYRDLIGSLLRMDRFFNILQNITPGPEDYAAVERMSIAQVREALDLATPQDIALRPGFYAALYRQVLRSV